MQNDKKTKHFQNKYQKLYINDKQKLAHSKLKGQATLTQLKTALQIRLLLMKQLSSCCDSEGLN